MHERRGAHADPQHAADEMRESAGARPGGGVELDGGILRAGAVGEPALAKLRLQENARLAQRDRRRRAAVGLGRDRTDDFEQPLAAPDFELGLPALVKDAGDGATPLPRRF
jgi:hypothetical protein